MTSGMTLDEIGNTLRDIRNATLEILRDARANLFLQKRDVVARGDEVAAKFCWCLETSIDVHTQFINSFNEIKNGNYYQAWCLLERVEISIENLARHFLGKFKEYNLSLVDKLTKQWQRLYPYKIFMSPEFLKTEKKCSICDQVIRIRHGCGHRVGEIYGGELCLRIVTKSEVLGISMVENPVQKYSVPFLRDSKTGETRDQYNYSLVRFVIERLTNPFDDWNCKWTTKDFPQSRFRCVGRNELCPCGSGRKFKKCCSHKSTVTLPHLEVELATPPPIELPLEKLEL